MVLAFKVSQADRNSAFSVSRSLLDPIGSPPGLQDMLDGIATDSRSRLFLARLIRSHDS